MNILKTLRKPYFALFLTSLILFSSCSTNEQIDEIDNSAILQKKIENKNLISKFIKLQNSAFAGKDSFDIEFDNNNIYEVSIDGNSESIIMANQIGFNEENTVNYGIGAAITENGFANPLIIKTVKNSNNIFTIEYFNNEMQLISTIELNSETETINISNNRIASLKCGQAVADCLDDVYSNHGWVSVWAFVQTAFIPATGLALAAACAADECL